MNFPTPALAPSLLLAVAVQATRRAGDYARQQRARRNETLLRDRHDVKLALDVECQSIAAETIAAAFPEHALLGEEDEPSSVPRAWHWVVDPIDGTVNYSHGLPHWCCSIAARHEDRTLAGAVYAPDLGLMFEASSDGPARCNGTPIRVSRVERLDHAIVQTGADKEYRQGGEPCRFFQAIAAHVQRPRISGSAALDLCEVARGGADAYFQPGIFLWDVAAGALIVERAGGRTEILHRHDAVRFAFLAANNSVICDQMRPLLVPLCREYCNHSTA